MNNLKNFMVAMSLIMLASCGGETVKVETMKKTDKDLSCNDILLEINETEFHKKQAQEKKSLGIKSIVMPLGYIDTYMSADEAISAADSRIAYLNRIYEIKNCDNNVSGGSNVPVYLNNPQQYQLQPPAVGGQGYYR